MNEISVKKNNLAVFLCGGSGTRMRGSVADKILAPLAGTPARSSDGVFREAVVEPAQNLASIEEAAILVPVMSDVLEVSASAEN